MLYNHGRTWVKPHGTASIHVSMYAAGKKYWRGCLRLRRTGLGQRDCRGPLEAWHEAHSLYRVVLGTSRVHLDADTARAAASLSAANGSFTRVSRGVQTTAQVCGGARGRVSWARRAVDGSDEAERATARHHGLIQGYGINNDSHAAPQPDPRARREVSAHRARSRRICFLPVGVDRENV